MRKATILCLLGVLMTFGLQAQNVADELVAAAERAFQGGNGQEALRLYDQALAENPQHVKALVRSAMMLSWEGKSEEAIRRYERALVVDPHNETARLERAKVLSWSQQYAKALAAFREIAAADPANVEVQLGIARILSWSGKQPAARTEYLKILHGDPKNVDATVGIAQTYAWSGDQINARTWYVKALAFDPQRREAEMGLAYADLADGDVQGASKRSASLHSRFPQDKEVGELSTAVRRAAAPAFRATVDHLEDTGSNEIDFVGAEAGFALPHRADLTVGITRHDFGDGIGRDGQIESGFVSLLLRPTSRQRVVLRPAIDRISKPDGSSKTELAGHLTYAFGLGTKVEGSLELDRQAFRATTISLDHEIVVESYSVLFAARPLSGWRVSSNVGTWRLSDSNRRDHLDLGVSYGWTISRTRVETGAALHYFDYEQSMNHGYFDPQSSIARSLTLSINREFKPVYLSAFAETGLQTFELGGVRSPREQYLTWAAMIGFRLTPMMALEFTGTKSNAALSNPTGFESEQYAARLRIQGR